MNKSNLLFAKNLNDLMRKKDVTQTELAKFTKVSQSSVNRWTTGSMPTPDKVDLICLFFGVTPADLLLDPDVIKKIPRTESREIPLYGSVSAGLGFFAESNVLRYISMDSTFRGDFAVIVKGDSMVNAGIMDGDIAFFRKDFRFKDGNIYAVLQMGEDVSYLKRVYHQKNRFVLVSENAQYPPIVIENNEGQILGELCGIHRSMQ